MADHSSNSRPSNWNKHSSAQGHSKNTSRPPRPGSKADVQRRHDQNEGRSPKRPR